MKLEELKAKIDRYQEWLEGDNGAVVVFSDTGPASMPMIHHLFSALETQAKRIDELEQRLTQE